MDVLIIEDSPTEAMTLAKVAETLGHRAFVLPSADAALAHVRETAPDMVITDLMMPGMSGADLVTQIRAMELSRYVYVIMRTARTTEDVMTQAFMVGVDDFITKSRSLEELRARIRVGERIVGLETKLRTRVRELESALRRLDIAASVTGAAIEATVAADKAPPPDLAAPPADGIAALGAWRAMQTTLGAVMAEFAQQPFSPAGHVVPVLRSPMATAISLTDVAHELEIGITLIADQDVVHSLAKDLFGETDDEVVGDFFSELANIAMGATKSSFLKEEHTFTGGLPRKLVAPKPDAALAAFPDRQTLAFESNGRAVYALVGARRKGRVRVEVARLREGMVLAKDVLGPNGLLLIRAGTRVTETLAERLMRVAPRLEVELADPGDA
ncbi:MAG: response regulator [Polyangiaceae bacterium]